MRPIYEIAKEIREDWAKVSCSAEPYLGAMEELTSIEDKFIFDPARDIIHRFLANCGTWRGEKAREIKAELIKLSGGRQNVI